MDADYDMFEIAAVIRDFWLIDSESYQRKYSTQQGKPLEPGVYVVVWPEHIRVRRFNEHARFHGPFKSRDEANIVLEFLHKHWKQALTRTQRAFAYRPLQFWPTNHEDNNLYLAAEKEERNRETSYLGNVPLEYYGEERAH